MYIYYAITVAANILATIVFYQNINITAFSLLPICLIVLMLFQASIFKTHKTENGFRTMYGSNLTADEENSMFSKGSSFLFATIPWMIPFVVFFSSPIKALSILVYVIGLIGGLVWYRLKNIEKIKRRMNTEEMERAEQEKKEEMGK